MKYTSQILLFISIIIIVNCKKAEEDKFHDKNLNFLNKDTLIPLKDSSKIIIEVNTNNKNYWDGDYSIKTKAISNNEDKQEIVLRYYINIKDKKAVLSIGAESSEDYWCEGDYYLEIKDGGLYATGKCDEDDTNDFMIKLTKNQYYIKSKRFKNIDWQLLSKE